MLLMGTNPIPVSDIGEKVAASCMMVVRIIAGYSRKVPQAECLNLSPYCVTVDSDRVLPV